MIYFKRDTVLKICYLRFILNYPTHFYDNVTPKLGLTLQNQYCFRKWNTIWNEEFYNGSGNRIYGQPPSLSMSNTLSLPSPTAPNPLSAMISDLQFCLYARDLRLSTEFSQLAGVQLVVFFSSSIPVCCLTIQESLNVLSRCFCWVLILASL